VKNLIPKTYLETLELLSSGDYRLLAGGTDLMIQRRSWSNMLPKFRKSTLLIFNLQEMKYMFEEDYFLHIGAGTSLEDIKDNDLTPELLVEAINIMASPAIRNMATLGGNIGNASPAGDSLPVLYVLNALIVLESIEAIREVPISDFIVGPGRKSIKLNEIIKEIRIPIKQFTQTKFEKVGGRKADAISKISFAGAVEINNNIIQDFRVSFGAVGPTVVRKKSLENEIIGQTLAEAKLDVENILKSYEPFITPINDQRSNKEYRKEVALNILESFILTL